MIGYGKAGAAVCQQLSADPRYDVRWIARKSAIQEDTPAHPQGIAFVQLDPHRVTDLFDAHPVDAIVDFSAPESLLIYGEEVRRRHIMLVSAISAYPPEHLVYARSLGESARVLCSPNITLGINFLILAAKLLRNIAPFADIEILEQHFKGKPEVSGTARKIAASLEVGDEKITSLRLGGIIGHHEVIFGFPYQTVRLVHESISREAFGTGAAFALSELHTCPNGFYTIEDLLMTKIRMELTNA